MRLGCLGPEEEVQAPRAHTWQPPPCPTQGGSEITCIAPNLRPAITDPTPMNHLITRFILQRGNSGSKRGSPQQSQDENPGLLPCPRQDHDHQA